MRAAHSRRASASVASLSSSLAAHWNRMCRADRSAPSSCSCRGSCCRSRCGPAAPAADTHTFSSPPPPPPPPPPAERTNWNRKVYMCQWSGSRQNLWSSTGVIVTGLCLLTDTVVAVVELARGLNVSARQRRRSCASTSPLQKQ